MKTVLTGIAVVFTLSLAQAQKMKEAAIPAAVKDGFKKEFPGATAKEWEKEGDAYEVEFDLKKTETSAVFNSTGKLLETEQEIKTAELPAPVAGYVKGNYAGYKITEAAKITEAGSGKVTFEAEVSKGKTEMDLVFDDKGNFLTKETDDKEDDKD